MNPDEFQRKTFDQLHAEGLVSPRGVTPENLELLETQFPFFDDECIISVVGIYTLTLALTNKRLIEMMGSRQENLTFITIKFSDIDPTSI
jgi:hypothetical protein